MCLSTHGVEVAAKFALLPFDETTRPYFNGRTDHDYEPIVADSDATYEKEMVVNVDEIPFVVAKPHHFGNVFPVADSASDGTCSATPKCSAPI